MVGADIEFICRKASVIAIREIIESMKELDQTPDVTIVIKEKHFDEVVQLVKMQNLIKN
jgi:transitional endoplasmic reticulum ATPase